MKNKIINNIKMYREYLLSVLIVLSFAAYYFDWLKDGMMMSGIIALILTIYISVIWSEKVYDERDEYIRSKVDRWLYIITMLIILCSVVYKTFTNSSYMLEVFILTALALSKVFLSKIVKEEN